MKIATLTVLSALSFLGMQSHANADGFPTAISFQWDQPTARFQGTGTLSGYSNSSSYRPTYNVQFKAGNDVRQGVLTLNWSWPSRLDFTFYNVKTGSTCPGTAMPQGNQYVGSMTCQAGTYPIVIR